MEIANLQAIISVETTRLRAGLASADAQLAGTAAKMREVDAQTRLANTSMAATGRSGAMARAGATAAKVGLAALGFAAYEGYKRMQDQEKVAALTANTLRNLHGASALTAREVEHIARSMALTTGTASPLIQSAENVLLGFKSISGNADTFRSVLTAAMDRSAKSGRDLVGVTRAIGLAFNDPIGGMGRLARAGIFLDTETKKQIKTMAEAGKVDQARALLMDKVASSARGAAVALGQTTTGQVNRMKEALGQMSEEVAQAVLPALLSIGPPLISLVRSLAPAFKVLGEAVGAIVRPIAGLISAITSSRVGTIALTTALGTLLALGVAAKITSWAQALYGFAASMATGISGAATRATTALTGVAAEAGTAGAAMGGPLAWGIMAAATAATAIGIAIGPDLLASFRGAGSATDQYAQSMARAQQAAQGLRGAVQGLPGAVDALANAHRREAAARRAAAADPGDLGKQAAYKQAVVDTAKARDASIAGIQRTAQATRDSAAAGAQQVTKLLQAAGVYGALIPGTHLAADSQRKFAAASKAAADQVGNSTAWKQAQADYANLAVKLQAMGPKYAGVAREASKLANMKPGPEAAALADKIGGQLDKIAGKAAKTKPSVTVKAETSQAQRDVDALVTKLNNLNGRTFSFTIQQNGSVPAQAGGQGAGEAGYAGIVSDQRRAPSNYSNLVGSVPQEPGLLDLIAQLQKLNPAFATAGITVDGVRITMDGAANAAKALMTDLRIQSQAQAAASAYARFHTVAANADTEQAKKSAQAKMAHQKANLIASATEAGLSKAAISRALKHGGVNALLAATHDAATKKAAKHAIAILPLQDALAKAIAEASSSATLAVPEIQGVGDAIGNVGGESEAAQKRLSQVQTIIDRTFAKLRDALTPTEALIKRLQDEGNMTDLTNSIGDAQEALRNAMDFGSPQQIRDAQRALATAQRNMQVAQLQPMATAERNAVNDFFDSISSSDVAKVINDTYGGVVNSGTVAGAIQIVINDNTYAGMSRDAVDNLARQIAPALGRQVTLAY